MSFFLWKKKDTINNVVIETITRLELALSKQSKQIQELTESIRNLEILRHDELSMQTERVRQLSKELGKYEKYKKYVVIDEQLEIDCIYNSPANSIGSPYDK